MIKLINNNFKLIMNKWNIISKRLNLREINKITIKDQHKINLKI